MITFRRDVRRMLVDLALYGTNETWGEWATKAKGRCDEIASGCGVSGHKVRLGALFKAFGADKPGKARVSVASLDDLHSFAGTVEVLTIHEAKGREFDAVIIYWDKPKKIPGGGSTCPAASWWAAAECSEEREVAFVPVTRARRLLTLIVHEESWKALDEGRKAFASLFQPLPSADTN